MNERYRTLLSLYYRIDSAQKLSLAEIAGHLNIPRSRAVLLKEKAINQLRRPVLIRPIAESLKLLTDDIWLHVSEPAGDILRVVKKNDVIKPRFLSLPRPVLLALQCMYSNDFDYWLSEYFHETSTVWFKSDYPADLVLKAHDRFVRICRDFSFPIHISFLMEQLEIDRNLVNRILVISPDNYAIYGDYIAKTPLDSSALRSIRIHLLLSCKHRGPVMIDSIIGDYNSLYNDAKLTPSISERIMARHPSLFQQIDGSSWKSAWALGLDNNVAAEHTPRSSYYFSRVWRETKASEIIIEILEYEGICSCSALIDFFSKTVSDKFTIGNIGPALMFHKQIIKFAPGYYGIHEHLDLVKQNTLPPDLLMTVKDCRKYIYTRFAGEPANTYPLWNAAMEKKWYDMAEAFHNYQLRYSLLYVSDPGLWPGNENERKEWGREKQINGRYYLSDKASPHPLWSSIPTLQELFILMLWIKQTGSINWLRINSKLKISPYNKRLSASCLALLINLKIIDPEKHWQKKHQKGSDCEIIIDQCVEEISNKGFLHWDDPVGIAIRLRMADALTKKDQGWVPPRELSLLIMAIDNQDISDKIKGSRCLTAMQTSGMNDINESKSKPQQMTLF
ncbi:MAG: sigma factor-like helix-turn-helix DNA-binding protein [Thermodesulfobacteriota bacterium]|nr:sigma factor-like helix-turn-helix DNA-binding protein [Thermodesulfobacteriota bacterium]